jgi:hypothetical protein
MSGLKNTVKRFANASMFKGYKTNREIKQEKAAKIKAGKDEQYANAQIPDEEQIKRNERRKAAKRQGSRANTVLTNPDRLG